MDRQGRTDRAMVLEINMVDVHPGREGAFEAAFAEAAPLLRRVRGCVGIELSRCVERPGRYQVRVEWETLADHRDHYPTTAEAGQVRALLLPLIAAAEPAHFEPL